MNKLKLDNNRKWWLFSKWIHDNGWIRTD